MSLTCEDIKKLENPDEAYNALNNADLLLEHSQELEKLSPEEMNSLAERIIIGCPNSEMQTFGFAIDALQKSAPSFSPIIYLAYETKKRILALSDPRNPHPHSFLLGNEFNAEIFDQFNNLALTLLKDNEIAIATRLAKTTPREDWSTLCMNVRNAFPGSTFSVKVATAYSLRREIEDHLLGEKPQDFFSSREFKPDLCHEFYDLVTELVKGHEENIGKKLKDSKMVHEINRHLEMLDHQAHDKHNPFRLIAAAMTEGLEPVKTEHSTDTASTIRNRNAWFTCQNHKTSKETTKSTLNDSDSEEEKEDTSCLGKLCGFLF